MGETVGRRCRKQAKLESATLECFSIVSGKQGVEEPRKRAKICVAPNRPHARAFRSIRKHGGGRCREGSYTRPLPKSAIWEDASIDSRTRGAEGAGIRDQIRAASNRLFHRTFRSISGGAGSGSFNEGVYSTSSPNRPLGRAYRSFRKNRGSRMPRKGLNSTSPRIGHARGRFDRFGKTGGRGCPEEG